VVAIRHRWTMLRLFTFFRRDDFGNGRSVGAELEMKQREPRDMEIRDDRLEGVWFWGMMS
jgi:hypothetical protein